ncbi:MAG: hypothetical protein CL424_16380 [Acidimicrobiaceae bacterium]|nr:hypothetical protein [Acidimicrobiaceae bacterium]
MTTRFAAVTVLGGQGGEVPRPHTTPVAAVRHAGRWWFTTSRGAAKVTFLRDEPVASVTVADRTGWTTTTGDVTILDPADPLALVGRPAALSAWSAALGLLGAYARDVAGYLTQLHTIPAAWAPHQRVLVAVEEQIVEHAVEPEVRPPDASMCIAGCSDGHRPLAVPGWFDGDELRIAATARPISADDGVAIMLDTALLDDDPARPTDQRGVLVRGRLLDTDAPGQVHDTIAVVARSITTWNGFTTETRRFRTDPARAA